MRWQGKKETEKRQWKREQTKERTKMKKAHIKCEKIERRAFVTGYQPQVASINPTNTCNGARHLSSHATYASILIHFFVIRNLCVRSHQTTSTGVFQATIASCDSLGQGVTARAPKYIHACIATIEIRCFIVVSFALIVKLP